MNIVAHTQNIHKFTICCTSPAFLKRMEAGQEHVKPVNQMMNLLLLITVWYGDMSCQLFILKHCNRSTFYDERINQYWKSLIFSIPYFIKRALNSGMCSLRPFFIYENPIWHEIQIPITLLTRISGPFHVALLLNTCAVPSGWGKWGKITRKTRIKIIGVRSLSYSL